MVTFAPKRCSCIKVYSLQAIRCEIQHSHRAVWHCASTKRIFTCLLMHRHNCSARWLKIFSRIGTTESRGDFFLLNLRKTPGVRANAALSLCPETRIMCVAGLKNIAFIQERHGRCLNTVKVSALWKLKSWSFPAVYFPRGTLQLPDFTKIIRRSRPLPQAWQCWI